MGCSSNAVEHFIVVIIELQNACYPTYEYTVSGKTYRYASRQTVSGKRELGRQVVGYYDPTRPDCITENKPRKPVLGGMCFFMFAAFLLWFGIMSFAGMLSIS